MSENTSSNETSGGQLYLITDGKSPRKIINLGKVSNPGKAGGVCGSHGNPGDHEYLEVLVEYTKDELKRRNPFKPKKSLHHYQVVRKEKIGALR